MKWILLLFFCCSCVYGAQPYENKKTEFPRFGCQQLKDLLYEYERVYHADWSKCRASDYLCARLALIKQATEYFYRHLPVHMHEALWRMLMYNEKKAMKLYIFCRHSQTMLGISDAQLARTINQDGWCKI